MQLAIKFNKIDIVKSILNTGKAFLGTLETKYNPLLDACEKDLAEIAILLIENGADVNVTDNEQYWTPLMHAITNNNEIIMEKLVAHKSSVNSADVEGNTPLHLAVLTENEYLVKCLLKASPIKNSRNKDNQTPLDVARGNDDESITKLLS